MPALTQEQMEQYIAIGGVRCPYCGSAHLEGEGFDGGASPEIGNCHHCSARWKDIYSLVRVEDIDE